MKTCGFQCYVHRTNVLQTECNSIMKFPFWVYNKIYMKSILCQRRRVYASKKEVYLFLYKHVKFEKRACAVV